MKSIVPSLCLLLFACSSDKGVTVFNPNPQAEIISHSDGDAFSEGYPIELIGNVDDPNHSAGELTTTWKSATRTLCTATPPESDGTTRCGAVLAFDDEEIILAVKDPENARGEARVTLDISPSENPSAQIITPSTNETYYSDQKITFAGVVADSEDSPDRLVAFWESDIDGLLSEVDSTPENDGTILGYGYLSEGEHAIELTVEDTTGKTDRSSVIIDVGPPNTAPDCQIISPTTGMTGTFGDLVTFAANANDVDIPEDMLTATWRSDKDGELGNAAVNSDGSISFPFSELSVNTHVVTLTVADEMSATCTASVTYTVGTPPSILLDTPINGSIYNEGETIWFSVTVSDEQDQPDEIDLDWMLNGAVFSVQSATTNGQASFSDESLLAGNYTLVVTATDSDGLTAIEQVEFIVNGIPSQPNIEISPAMAYTTDDVTAVLQTPSIDPEGNTVAYTYEWYKDGVLQSGQLGQTISSSATAKGQIWKIVVTPNDGLVDGPSAETQTTILNTPPILDTITITPSSGVLSNTPISCSATFTDPDETLNILYQWTVNSSVVATGTTIDLATITTTPNDIVTCIATATDNSGETATGNTSVTIDNSIPIVQSVSLSPTVVYTEDEITATATFFDDDSTQTVTGFYAWHVIDADTGIDSEVQNGTNNVLSGVSFFDKDDQLYVIVTPNDGLEDGTPFTSTSLSVSNTAPTTPTIGVSPSAANIGEDITCEIDTPAVDADGDTILYTYSWSDPTATVAQTTGAVTNLSDTLSGADTWEGQWTCAVTASDGTDQSSTVTTFVDVSSNQSCSSTTFQAGEIAEIEDVDLSGAWTLDFWIRTFVPPEDNGELVLTQPANPYSIHLDAWGVIVGVTSETCNSSIQGWLAKLDRDGSASVDTITGVGSSTGSVNDGTWNHLAIVADGSGNGTFYINGGAVQTISTAGAGGTDLCTLRFGASADDTHPLASQISAVRLQSTSSIPSVVDNLPRTSDTEWLINVGYPDTNGMYVDTTTGTEFTIGEHTIWDSGPNCAAAISTTEVFDYSGQDQHFTVPSQVERIFVQAWGAGGASGGGTDCAYNPQPIYDLDLIIDHCGRGRKRGGAGGYSEGWIPVTPGQQLTVVVGQGGQLVSNQWGYGGGGPMGVSTEHAWAGGGGGLSGIFDGTPDHNTAMLIAGGGGGAGRNERGAAGGGLLGRDGPSPTPFSGPEGGGGGGSQTAGGFVFFSNATEGSPLQGGQGQGQTGDQSAGGGGSGYYGGGGGSSVASNIGPGGGGGGSGYISAGVSSGWTIAGNGRVPPNATDLNYANDAGYGASVFDPNYNGASIIDGAEGSHGRVVVSYE